MRKTGSSPYFSSKFLSPNWTMQTQSLPNGGGSVTLALFTDVRNSPQIRSQAAAGKIPAAMLATTLLCSDFHVLAAVNKAVMNRDQQQMRTRNIFSEIIYSLSPSTNISESFKSFGMRDSSTSVLAVILHPDSDNSSVETVLSAVEGNLIPLEQLTHLSDQQAITKVYKVTPEESAISSLENSVVTKIVTRDVT